MSHTNPERVAVIGAGPVGLAAAAHLLARGLQPLVFEAGDAVGASVREWGHVRVFSPWEFNTDPAAVELLERHGWTAPEPRGYPTGSEIVERYLAPLAATPEIAPTLHLGARVVGVTARGDRQAQGRRPRGRAVRAGRRRAGRWSAGISPTPSSTPRAPGRARTRSAPAACRRPVSAPTPTASATASRMCSAPPAPGTPASACWSSGSGHSAFNAILDLVALRDSEPATQIVWAIRGGAPGRKYGGGGDDQLPARGALGAAVRDLVADGAVALAADFQTRACLRARRQAGARRRRARARRPTK